VTVEGEEASYIAARLLTPKGKIWEPLHEHALTRRFPQKDGAKAAWSAGFETISEFFVPRQIIERIVEQGAAEEIQPILKPYVPQEPESATPFVVTTESASTV
jgi:hypothetical protein